MQRSWALDAATLDSRKEETEQCQLRELASVPHGQRSWQSSSGRHSATGLHESLLCCRMKGSILYRDRHSGEVSRVPYGTHAWAEQGSTQSVKQEEMCPTKWPVQHRLQGFHLSWEGSFQAQGRSYEDEWGPQENAFPNSSTFRVTLLRNIQFVLSLNVLSSSSNSNINVAQWVESFFKIRI